MNVADGLSWRHIYWVNGPTKGGTGMGFPARGDTFKLESRRAVFAVQDPPVNGWSSAFVIEGDKRSVIFCPFSLTSYQVPNTCAELLSAKEPKEWRKDFMVGVVTKAWAEAQKFGFSKDFDTAAMVLKRLGAEVPHRVVTADGEDTRSRGGKEVEAEMKKPVKRKGKRGDFLTWWMAGDAMARPVREAMAHFGMTRSNVLSYLFILQKDHGIGYALQGDLATIQLPVGVTDPFETEKEKSK